MRTQSEKEATKPGALTLPLQWLLVFIRHWFFWPRPPHRKLASEVLLVAALVIPLSACTLTPSYTSDAGATKTPVAVVTRVPTTPTTSNATSTNADAATATAAASTPGSDIVAAIQQVIQRANQEQEQALASNDPTLMRDTSTDAYYGQLVQDLQSLSASGVTAIHLADVKWGEIASQGPSTVQATTVETWDTTFGTSGSLQQSDTNVYTLVLQGGEWKIQADQHPDIGTLQPPPGSPGSSGASGSSGSPGVTTPADASTLSENWAGYAATGGQFTAVSGSWTVPNVGTTTSPAADATWVGIGGVRTNDLIQAGTDAIVDQGGVSYDAWIEMLPQASQIVPLTVHAGDQVSVSIEQQTPGSWQIVIKNLTSDQTYQTTVLYQSSLSSADWIEESPAAGRRQLLPLDDFGSVSFTSATAVENGQQRSIDQAGGRAITMQIVSGQPLAQTSTLGADGSSFTVSRTDVPAPRITPRGRHFGG
jgi:hypothetical protein